jgi:hypothetical protein
MPSFTGFESVDNDETDRLGRVFCARLPGKMADVGLVSNNMHIAA